MATRKFKLTEGQVRDLEERIQRSGNQVIRARLRGVLLYGTGHSISEIQEQLSCSRSCLLKWCVLYQTSGVAGLEDQRRGGNNAHLSPQQVQDLTQRLRAHSPRDLPGFGNGKPANLEWTVKDLFKAVKLWYGVVYRSRTSYYRLMDLYLASIGLPADFTPAQEAQPAGALYNL